MRFLVDAHLPPSLCEWLKTVGHDAMHTSQLSSGNKTSDQIINEISMREQRVVISKDADFYHSLLLHGEPWQLLLIRTGNIRSQEFLALFQTHLPAIVAALENNSLVELDRQQVIVHKNGC